MSDITPWKNIPSTLNGLTNITSTIKNLPPLESKNLRSNNKSNLEDNAADWFTAIAYYINSISLTNRQRMQLIHTINN